MLYTESMEIASPIAPPREEAKPTTSARGRSWTDVLENRWARPHIDLGLCLGSNSFVVTAPGKSFVYPARVAVRSQKGKAVAFGPQAAEIEGREPEGVTVLRPIVAGVVVNQRLATQLLSAAMGAAKHGVVSSPRVAVAVPSDLSAVESQTLLATVKAAGARSVYLVEQTLAAAIGTGRDLFKAEGHLVIHAGAGVTHVSVTSLASPVLSRSVRVAGDTMNEAIRDHVRREHHLLIDDRVAEQIKRELGSALPPVGESVMTVCGRDITQGKPSERKVNAQEIYSVLAPLFAQIAQEVRWVVGAMPTALLGDVQKNGAILSGGLAELRRLDEFLAQETRLRVNVAASPEEVVSRGLQTLLKNAPLRKAVFHGGRVGHKTYEQGESKGTGLLGGLILSVALAFSAQSLPMLGQGAASAADIYLGAAFTPSIPLASSFGGWGGADPNALPIVVDSEQSELKAENNRLRKLLKAPLAKRSFKPIAADVVARDPRGWMSTLTLNVGENDDIRVGMTVTDGTNLVGQISRVEATRSQVRLFTDSKAVVAGKVPKKKGSGVVVGSGGDDVEMRYLDPDSGVEEGDWVVTSGHDEAFPAGIKLGWVTRVGQPSGQNTFSATIQPGMNVHQLQNVLVLRR
jgi:rod shape-determining protein MreB